jgi:heme exporter protein A
MLEALDLAAQRGSSRLYEGLSFTVGAGVALVVTGANGRGKTTLLRALAGLSEPTAGTIRLDGETVRPFSPKLRRSIAFAGHATALKDELTARENLASLATLAGATPSAAEIDAALDGVALGPRRSLPARVLSQGQRRRIGLARLSLVRRRVWILDEPVTALDAEGTALLGGMLDAHLAQGGLAVAATHAPLAVAPGRLAALSLD